MTTRDLALLIVGEIFLATVFVVGLLIGVALSRKDSQHDYCNRR